MRVCAAPRAHTAVLSGQLEPRAAAMDAADHLPRGARARRRGGAAAVVQASFFASTTILIIGGAAGRAGRHREGQRPGARDPVRGAHLAAGVRLQGGAAGGDLRLRLLPLHLVHAPVQLRRAAGRPPRPKPRPSPTTRSARPSPTAPAASWAWRPRPSTTGCAPTTCLRRGVVVRLALGHAGGHGRRHLGAVPARVPLRGAEGAGVGAERRAFNAARRNACTGATVRAGSSSCGTWPRSSNTTSSLPAMSLLELLAHRRRHQPVAPAPQDQRRQLQLADALGVLARAGSAAGAAPARGGCLRAASARSSGRPARRSPATGRHRRCARWPRPSAAAAPSRQIRLSTGTRATRKPMRHRFGLEVRPGGIHQDQLGHALRRQQRSAPGHLAAERIAGDGTTRCTFSWSIRSSTKRA